MLEIRPPDGWQPPEEIKDHQNTVNESQASDSQLSGSFEDIDKILDVSQAEQAAIKQIRQVPDAEAKPSGATIQKSAPATSNPILPTDDWTSAESKQRKKWIAIIASVVGAILICFALAVAIINAGKTPDQPVAENEPVDVLESEDISKSNEVSPDSETPAKQPAAEDQPLDASNLTDPGDISDNGAKSDELMETSPDQPPTIATKPPDVELDPDTTVSPAEVKPLDDLPGNGSPIAAAPDEANSSSSNLSNLDSLTSEMGELSELLEQSGTSILKIQDLAQANKEQQLIGMAKYFIKKPESERLDFAKQLALGCGGIRYNDARLTEVLRDITSITGVPITLDTDSLLAHLGPVNEDELNPIVSIDVKDVDFGAVIDAVIEPEGWSKSLQGSQSLMIQASSSGFVERTHRLPEFPHEDEEPGKQFVAAIQGLFAPQSWVQENNPAAIELKENEILVNNSIRVHNQIEDFIDKIQAAIDLTEDGDNPEAEIVLKNRWNSVAEKLNQPTGLLKSTDLLLTDLLAKILKKTGTTVLVDWERLMPMGWTPATRVPGHIEEEDIGDVLKQLARSMNVTVRAINSSTLELTTFEKAAQTVDLEVYHLGKVLDGPLNEKQTIRLIMETLGSQLQTPQVRWVYEPKCQSLILLAPQSLQRQVDSVIKQLETL